MNMKQPLSLFLVAILVASVFTVVGVASMPLRMASAQAVTIATSADSHDMTFFGEGAVQVVIDDEDTDDDGSDSIDVDIDIEGVEGTFPIPDTSDGSQRFEFFLVHEASTLVAGDFDGIAAAPTIITFGTGGDLDTGDGLFVDATIDIDYGEETVTLNYEESTVALETDRDVYGSTSLVYILIIDQDANINPTDSDSFLVPLADLDDLFVTTGATFVDAVTFDETGDNSAVFEGIVTLTLLDSGTDPELDFIADTVSLEVNDLADYAPVNATVNTSAEADEVSFEIDDSDGDISDVADLTFGTELIITVEDNDQNIDSDDTDIIEGGLVVEVDAADDDGDVEFLDLEETDDNTGIFNFDLANGELRITFLEDGASPVANNTIIELRAVDIEEDLIISYNDPLDDDSAATTVSEFAVALGLTPGSLTAPATVGVNDEFTVTLTEPDLNDNPRTRDSYAFIMADAGPWNLTKGGEDYGEIYTFDIEVDGEPVDFGAEDTSITVTETGINTGIFEFDIDMEEIGEFGAEGETLAIDDGADVEVSIDDFMADTTDQDEDDVTITIAKGDVGVDFTRTSMPIPPEDGSVSADGVGTAVITTMTINDPQRANQSNVEETLDFIFGDSPGTFTLEIDGDDVESLEITSNDGDGENSYEGDAAGCAGDGGNNEPVIVTGVSLCEVFVFEDLTETGQATGLFDAELEFSMAGVTDMDAQDWQDAEFTFTYFDDEGGEETGGFTFRGNDGIVTADQPSVTSGTVLTITVEDQDLNLDDAEIDQFESGDLGDGALLLIETEDEEIPDGVTDDTFDETGDDTGIFTATFVIGDDIQISDLVGDTLEQATNILITYEDEIDSAGGGGDEVEISVPIVSSTGSIQVTPALVGPATQLTILIVDADLDEDANSIDDYTCDEEDDCNPNSDDFFVSFASDRNEVGEGSPDIEETGPNTGVFMWTLELITDEVACADDDLDADEFAAEGGDTDATIGACPGDLISIRYEDELSGNGNSESVSEVVEVQSFDPEFAVADDSINPGDRVDISISDPDANRDPDIADSLTDIRVRSDSDQVGEEFSALETGRDTGVFRLSFGTSTGTASGAISVKTGDDVTVIYTDDFPADFEAEEEDKDFEFVIGIGAGGNGTIGSTTVTAPAATSPTGQQITAISTGQQVVLTTTVVNTQTNSLPFVALVEVRDSSDVTTYLAWQTGSLNPSGRAQVGLSWTPDFAGDYTVRTFVISSLNNPQILSQLSESELTVS